MDTEKFVTSKIPHNCLIKAKSVYETLKSAERKAVDYIFAAPEAIIGTSIVTTAGKAGCSEATLVRLAKKLGYEGYPEMKKDFAAWQNHQPGVVYKGITPQDGPLSVVEKVFAASMQSLRDTMNVLDKEEYGKAVSLLVGSKRILIAGLGDASEVAASLYQKFLRIDVDVRTSDDPDIQLVLASHLKPGDVTVAISHSGRTVTVLNTVKETRRSGAAVIAVTNYPLSPLAKAAAAVLLTADFSEHFSGEVVSKRVSELCIVESLYINYLIQKNGTLLEALAASNSAVDVYKC